MESPKESPFSAKSYEKFIWGFRAGLNFTTQHFADVDAREALDAYPKIGFTLGGVAQFKLTERYALQVEAGFTQKGTAFDYNDGFTTNTMNLQFIDMSLLLRRRFSFEWGKNVHSDVFIGAGPNVNYWLGGSGAITSGDGTPFEYDLALDGDPDQTYNTMFLMGENRWLFGIDLGVGISAPITAKQKIFLEFRASLGQTNLGSNDGYAVINVIGFDGSTFQQNLLKSNLKTFSITAAYTFSTNFLQSRMGKSTKDKMIKRKNTKRKRR